MKERKQPERPKPTWLDRAGEVIDRVCLAVAPSYGASRIATRQRFEFAQQRVARLSAYEGASEDKTRGSSWIGSRLSPDSALESDLPSLRLRSSELYRNDAIGGAIDNRVNHVIGEGFTPQSRIAKDIAGFQDYRKQIEKTHKRWSYRCDRTGRRSLWQLSRVAERLNSYAGESITVMSDIGSADAPIPLVLEVIDPDRLETPADKIGNPLVRMGIEYDKGGRIVAYWIRRTHPGDTLTVNLEYDRVPADRVCHVFESWYAGQSRGLPWMCRALLKIKDAKDLDEAAIIAAQIEACYAVFIKNTTPGAAAAAGAATGTENGHRTEDIIPGIIRYLDPNEEIQFASPNKAGSAYAPFQEWNYRRIAAAMNYPYEMLTKNWSGTSFAGGRLVLIDAFNDCRARQKLMVEQWLCPIWNRAVDEMVMVGAVDIPPREYFADPWTYQEHTWTPPAWRYAINPQQEIAAKLEKVKANVMPKGDVAAEEGYDLEEVYERRADEKKQERDLEIESPDEAAQPDSMFERAGTPENAEAVA